MKFFYLFIVSFFCLIPLLLNSQSKISNQVFSFNYSDKDYEFVNDKLLTEINQLEKKQGWNRYIGGLFPKNSTVSFIGFQYINRMIDCDDLQSCYSLMFSSEIKAILGQRGIEILETSTLGDNVLFSSTKNLNPLAYYHSFSIMTNSGFVTLKIQSEVPIVKSESLDCLQNLTINTDFIGFPHQGFFENLDWNKILLKVLTPGRIKIPKNKK